jgi:hypothetical protein
MSRAKMHNTAAALIEQISALTGPGTQLLHAQEREWASVTFSGARYRLELAVPQSGEQFLAAAIAALPEHEFTLRGVIVADCTAMIGGLLPGDGRRRAVTVEVLTVVAD